MDYTEIKSSRDFAKIQFDELFYKIYESKDKKKVVDQLIKQIDKTSISARDDSHRRAAMLCLVKHKLESERKSYIEAENAQKVQQQIQQQEYRNTKQQMQFLNIMSGGMFSSVLGGLRMGEAFNRLQNTQANQATYYIYGENDDIAETMYNEFDKMIEGIINGHDPLFAHYKTEKKYYDILSKLLSSSISKLYWLFHDDQVINGLFALQKIDSDQSLIKFLGKEFSASIFNLDAYTGLIYTSDYFTSYIKFNIDNIFPKDKLLHILKQERDEVNYKKAKQYLKDGDYEKSLDVFKGIIDYKDVKQQTKKVQNLIDLSNEKNYVAAEKLAKNNDYSQAISKLEEILGEYKDSERKIDEYRNKLNYKNATECYKEGNHIDAYNFLNQAIGIKGKEDLMAKIIDGICENLDDCISRRDTTTGLEYLKVLKQANYPNLQEVLNNWNNQMGNYFHVSIGTLVNQSDGTTNEVLFVRK